MKREGIIILLVLLVLISLFFLDLSYELLLLFTLISCLVFIFFKIDSRFFLFAGVLLIGYSPFLLIQRLDALAESYSIYGFFFLISGVIGRVIELKLRKELRIDFEKFFISLINSKLMLLPLIIFGSVTVFVFLYDEFMKIPYFFSLRFTFLYLTLITAILNFFIVFKKKEKKKEKKAKLKIEMRFLKGIISKKQAKYFKKVKGLLNILFAILLIIILLILIAISTGYLNK